MFVEIVEIATEKVIKRMGPMDARKAQRVQAGADVNLNHEQYLVRIVNK
jgi:hypothetical protein